MRILQRMVLVFGVVMFMFVGMSVAFLQKKEKMQNQWEQVLGEKFLSKLCNTEKFTFIEYQQLLNGLEKGSSIIGIEIEEYRKEEDLQGNNYYYLVAWEELKTKLLSVGHCRFQKGSIVRLKIQWSNEAEVMDKSYWNIVTGKEVE